MRIVMTSEVRLYDSIGPNVLPRRGIHTLYFVVVAALLAYVVFAWNHYGRVRKQTEAVELHEESIKQPSRDEFEHLVDTLSASASHLSNDIFMAKLYECTCTFVGGSIGVSLESVSATELERYNNMLGEDVVSVLKQLYMPVFSPEEPFDRNKITEGVKKTLYDFHQRVHNASTSTYTPGE